MYCTWTNGCIANFSTDTGIEPLNSDTVLRVMREENISQPSWHEIASKLGFKPHLNGQNSAPSFVQGWHTFARLSQPSWKQLGRALRLIEDYKSKAEQIEQYSGKYNRMLLITYTHVEALAKNQTLLCCVF